MYEPRLRLEVYLLAFGEPVDAEVQFWVGYGVTPEQGFTKKEKGVRVCDLF